MAAILDAWAWSMAGALLTASLQGALPIGVVWLLCRRVKAIVPSMRALMWWVAALGFVLSLLPLPSLRVPLLPIAIPMLARPVASDALARLPMMPAPNLTPPRHVEAAHRSPGTTLSESGVFGAVALWIAGLTMHLVRLVAAYSTLRGIVRRSAMVSEDVSEMAGRIADTLRLTRLPPIRISREIESALAAGLVRPVVLLPASVIASLSPEELAMAIGHELAHIRRRDLLWAWVPAIAERLFFFHPLARLAAREYAAERESACDALVLDAMDVAPQEYGRMLVRLGVGGRHPMFTMGGSSSSVSSLKRRLDMLNHVTSHRAPRPAIEVVALVAMLAVLPFRIVAGTSAPPQDPPAPSAAQAPAKSAQPAKPPAAAPAASRAPARAASTEAEQFQRLVEEQRLTLERMRDEFRLMQAQLGALINRAREQQQAEKDSRRLLEIAQTEQRIRESALNNVERQQTTQFLENELRKLTAEHAQTSARLGQLSAEIDSLRQKLENARRAQEIESAQKKADEKK